MKYPDWQPKYIAAVLEVNESTLLDRVADAEVAIAARLHSQNGKPDSEELQAIEGAIRGLRVLRKERVK
jgi:hypothetical protein